jgi:hypothetical protein
MSEIAARRVGGFKRDMNAVAMLHSQDLLDEVWNDDTGQFDQLAWHRESDPEPDGKDFLSVTKNGKKVHVRT